MLGPRQLLTKRGVLWLALLAAIPTILFAAVAFNAPAITVWYYQNIAPPRLHRDYGFTGNYNRPGRFVITSVEPGGVFDRAGVKPGDIPYLVHDSWTFYAGLACGAPDLQPRFWRGDNTNTVPISITPPARINALCLPF